MRSAGSLSFLMPANAIFGPGRSACLALRLQEGDEVSSLLILLDASEHHLRPWDILLGVDQVFEHMLVRPHDPKVLVGLGVGKTLASAGSAAHDAPQGLGLAS